MFHTNLLHNPLGGYKFFTRRMPSLHQHALNNFFMAADSDQHPTSLRTEMKEEEGHFLLRVEVPGYDKDDIKILFKDNVLSISAEEKKDEKSLRKAQVDLYIEQEAVAEDELSAHLDKGVLTINIPKKEKAAPKEIEIQVAS